MAFIGTRLDLIIFLMFLSIVSNNIVFARNNTLNKSVSATIVKEGIPPFYYMNINGEDYIMDLDSDFLWTRCDKWHVFHQPCPKQACSLAHSWPSRLCPLKKDQQERLCPCKVALVNPVPKTCHQTDLSYQYYFFFNQTGHWPFKITSFKQIYAACIPSELRATQFYNRTGQFVGLSKAPLSIPSQFASQYQFSKKFAFVLPSVRYPHGIIFFGGGPYYIVYYADKLHDVTIFFTYTQLLQNSLSTTNGYYIGVQAISIGSSELHQIPIQASSFDINYTTGLGGVRISTIVLYTTLRSDIFLAFRKTFLEAMEGKIPVRAVKQFDLCFNASDLVLNPLGGYIGAPKVELSLANGKNWTYFSNTMQTVYRDNINDTLACMAFIDGGKTMEEAMVIGAFQMEEIFVEFDLVKSQFGFTPNLFLLRKFNGSITG
ncbi:gamma conglutin 1-like [Impatiens glandulifera]|uniref:gamma conglutin 1-like n=1 Tax=Impatiens glandulifera TaxID=253017 RepID=UPI001FB17FAC|nr:gamma conglutin 1-like [Impatiens glandulifera]